MLSRQKKKKIGWSTRLNNYRITRERGLCLASGGEGIIDLGGEKQKTFFFILLFFFFVFLSNAPEDMRGLPQWHSVSEELTTSPNEERRELEKM